MLLGRFVTTELPADITLGVGLLELLLPEYRDVLPDAGEEAENGGHVEDCIELCIDMFTW